MDNLSIFTLHPTQETNLYHWKIKISKQITRKEWISKFTTGICEIPRNAVVRHFENHKI